MRSRLGGTSEGMVRGLARLAVVLVLIACTGEPSRQEGRGPTGADSVAMALERYDPGAFDTISWESREAAIDRGGTVYRISCSRCHGNAGRGDAGFVTQGDTLKPPSFLQADWRFANDKDALRKQIFAGREGGMPHWGLVGLKYRDVDAVATYVLEVIRLGVK